MCLFISPVMIITIVFFRSFSTDNSELCYYISLWIELDSDSYWPFAQEQVDIAKRIQCKVLIRYSFLRTNSNERPTPNRIPHIGKNSNYSRLFWPSVQITVKISNAHVNKKHKRLLFSIGVRCDWDPTWKWLQLYSERWNDYPKLIPYGDSHIQFSIRQGIFTLNWN